MTLPRFIRILQFLIIFGLVSISSSEDDFRSKLTICPDTPKKMPKVGNVCDLAKVGLSAYAPVLRDDCFPEWIDVPKFVQGQKMFLDNWGSFEAVEMMTLIGLVTFHGLSDVLLFTTTNDCPIYGIRRYVTTVEGIRFWAVSAIDNGNPELILDSIRQVRLAHARVGPRVRGVYKTFNGSLGNEERFKNSKLKNEIWDALHKDLEAAFQPEQLEFKPCYTEGLKKYVPMNQFEFAITQWTMTIMSATDRKKGYLSKMTTKDVEAFNHFWGVVTWILGIEDRFNIALQPNYKAINKYNKAIAMDYVLPALYNIDLVSKKFFEMTLERTTSLRLKEGDPYFLSLDGILMTFLRMVYDIPYDNLFANADLAGKEFVAVTEFLMTSNFPADRQDIFKTFISRVHEVWGQRGFGDCYTKWNSYPDKMKEMHYFYKGPPINPNGKKTGCTKIKAPCKTGRQYINDLEAPELPKLLTVTDILAMAPILPTPPNLDLKNVSKFGSIDPKVSKFGPIDPKVSKLGSIDPLKIGSKSKKPKPPKLPIPVSPDDWL